MEDKQFREIITEIQKNYRNKFKTDGEIFYHLLEQIGTHTIKLAKLKEKGDPEGHFEREIADMYLLALGLVELYKIKNKTIKDSADYYLNKVKKIYN